MNLQRTARIAVLAAMGYVLMLFEVNLPFFPSYLKYDVSEVPALIAAFTLGPAAGIAVEAIKDLLKLVINPGSGGISGLVANFIAGASGGGAAGLARKLLGGERSAGKDVMALAVGVMSMTVVMLLANGFVLFPIYFHMPVAEGWQAAVAISTPFNLVKGTLSSVAAALLYRPLANFLRSSSMVRPSARG